MKPKRTRLSSNQATLAKMAAVIAAGITAPGLTPEYIAATALDIATQILDTVRGNKR